VQETMDLDKQAEEFMNHRRILIECCKLNGIDPNRFIAIAWGIMVQEYKNNGKKLGDLEDMVGVCLKEAREMWDAMD
jgi:hypothetical protein